MNDHRVRVDIPLLPSSSSSSLNTNCGAGSACRCRCRCSCSHDHHPHYQAISSATLNGGTHRFVINDNNKSNNSNNTTTSSLSSSAHVINYKVPATYDGLHPPPLQLLENVAKNEKRRMIDCGGGGGGGDGGAVDNHDGSDTSSSTGLMLENTIGLLTAASMKTMTTASRSIIVVEEEAGVKGGEEKGEKEDVVGTTTTIHIDVIVTAGLSNARAVGADADYFVCCERRSNIQSCCCGSNITTKKEKEERKDDKSSSTMEPSSSSPTGGLLGTINTIVIVSGAPFTAAAQLEAYTIAVEAKCASCVNLGVLCAKDPTNNYGMGTGTDCCVLLSPCILLPPSPTTNRTSTTAPMTQRTQQPPQQQQHPATSCCCCCSWADTNNVIQHAGKHTLLAEMIGQAVQEATTNAIMINIRHLHYNYATYTLCRYRRILMATIRKGARPSYIPQNPMMPVPGPPWSVTLVGLCSVLAIYFLLPYCNEWGKLLLAAVIWDRFLGEPPLSVHPVCLAGSAIGLCLSAIASTPRVYTNPVLGFACGFVLLVVMLVIFLYGAWIYIQFADAIGRMAQEVHRTSGIGGDDDDGYDVVCHATTTTITATSCNKSMLLLMVKHALEMTSWILKLLLLKSTLSLQLLGTVALQMVHYLERNQINEARIQLAWLCSRDASKLNSSDLAGATLESLSENLSDGFIAPLFWYVLLGHMGALGYRIINTLDSRIGYRGKYEWFGKASARLDDLVNFVPA